MTRHEMTGNEMDYYSEGGIERHSYDVVVVGAGGAGLRAAPAAVAGGQSSGCGGGHSPGIGEEGMKPPAFAYERPTSVEATLAALARHGEGAKLLAGGQSLIAMLNLRLLAPKTVIDVMAGDARWEIPVHDHGLVAETSWSFRKILSTRSGERR